MSEPERLETGWDGETPLDDNLVHRFVTGYAAWVESSGTLAGNPVLRTDDFVAVDEGSAHPLLNHVIFVRPVSSARADAIAAEVAGFFGTGAAGAYSAFSPWPVPDRGFDTLRVEGHPPLMLRPTVEAGQPLGAGALPVPSELEVVAAGDVDGLADYEQVLVDGFPLEALQPHRRGVAFDASVLEVPGTQCFVGRVDGRPVSVAMSIATHGVNHVEFVATLPDARGRGYGAAVTSAATLAAPEVPALLVASDLGRPVYERLGYVALSRWTFLLGDR